MIIGLSGYARSGKDTTAGILVAHYGFERRAFADVLREAVYRLNPQLTETVRVRDVVDEYGWEVAKSNPEVRRLLQVMGTEVGRAMLGEDVWVRRAMKSLPAKTVFTDMRFPNEANAIRKRGGLVWRVNRPKFVAVNGHVSETALDSYTFDAVINNAGDLEFLAEQVEERMRVL